MKTAAEAIAFFESRIAETTTPSQDVADAKRLAGLIRPTLEECLASAKYEAGDFEETVSSVVGGLNWIEQYVDKLRASNIGPKMIYSLAIALAANALLIAHKCGRK